MRAGLQSGARAVLESPSFALLKKHIVGWTGLAYYETRDRDLARIVWRRMSKRGIADGSLYLALLNGGNAESAAEMDELIALLTVGESYFFRDKNQWDALRHIFLPGLIRENKDSRRLSIWSAGCSTGAEPYSLAILLTRSFGEELAGWRVRILGTDINTAFLAQALVGRFPEWSFRSTPDEIRKLCFRPQEGDWEIAPEYRPWISFERHNLVRDPFPEGPFDLIVCRNVSIYFSRETARWVMNGFAGRLNDRGLLMTGPAELAGERLERFQPVNAKGATLYRKVGPLPLAPPEPPASPAVRMEGAPGSPAAAAGPDPPPEGREEGELEKLLRLGDCGEWDQAALHGRLLVERQSLDPLVYLYYGLILESRGDSRTAEVLLRKALYLDPRCVLAHYHLGLVLKNYPDQAARSFQRARLLLDGMLDEQSFAEADGITVTELKKAIEIQVNSRFETRG